VVFLVGCTPEVNDLDLIMHRLEPDLLLHTRAMVGPLVTAAVDVTPLASVDCPLVLHLLNRGSVRGCVLPVGTGPCLLL